jgi:hypothetical protein
MVIIGLDEESIREIKNLLIHTSIELIEVTRHSPAQCHCR